ncbi:Regulation of nuclear pre-mRNA domain-containing protein 2 [Portunus trituberculatus]|uniref:Regulation of nuclear pre-mRNA domain-containing protein 2 n=1 Tax=Portunus trituberculatus TaxID=210409 RepID=A0A5B7IHF0_PORTR|nr:Regulation of nuclear pre-mRNA domain-containing protein 2 [Portunus trituberculatus]
MEEFEEAVIALECYLAAVQKEVEERTQVVTLLEQAEIFYETQRGEARLVANQYSNMPIKAGMEGTLDMCSN